MRRLLFITFLLLSTTVFAQDNAQYTSRDSVKATRIMRSLGSLERKEDSILFIARQLTGVPYVAQTLEKNKRERLVINLRQLDCTTFVENVLALYLCCKQKRTSFKNFCDNLKDIRYACGNIGYESRLHYFSQWIESNAAAGRVKEIQSPTPPFSKTQTLDLHFMSKNHDKYPMLANNKELVGKIAEHEKEFYGKRYKYISKTDLGDSALLRQTIKDGDILAIVTSKAGLDTSHIGLAVWHEDGLHLLNASQIHKKVVEESLTLSAYMRQHPSQTGIRVIRIL